MAAKRPYTPIFSILRDNRVRFNIYLDLNSMVHILMELDSLPFPQSLNAASRPSPVIEMGIRYQLGRGNRFPRLIYSSAVINSLRYGRNIQFRKNAVWQLSAVQIA